MKIKSITIIGAGASGLLASILIARFHISVTLLEQNNKVGKKILASGNGKCNIGNLYPTPQRYHSTNMSFVDEVLRRYSADDIIKLFDSLGIPIVEGGDNKLFPMSMQASSVVEILLYEAQNLGVNIVTNCKVTSVKKIDDRFTIDSSQGEMRDTAVLLASGSMASPQLGGSGSGLEISSSLGHTIIPSYPSLVQLCSDESWVSGVSGVKVDAEVKLYANGEYISRKKGDILFTNYGISGLAILDISREVSENLTQYSYCELSLDILPHYTKEKLTNLLLKYIDTKSSKPIDIWMMGFINKKLIPIIIDQSKCKATTLSQLNRKELVKLVYALKNLKLSISDSRGYKGAEVASGGVDTHEIDPKTMESKIIKNLYFTGEIIDVDGDRGGFNFHLAWIGAMKAAEALCIKR